MWPLGPWTCSGGWHRWKTQVWILRARFVASNPRVLPVTLPLMPPRSTCLRKRRCVTQLRSWVRLCGHGCRTRVGSFQWMRLGSIRSASIRGRRASMLRWSSACGSAGSFRSPSHLEVLAASSWWPRQGATGCGQSGMEDSSRRHVSVLPSRGGSGTLQPSRTCLSPKVVACSSQRETLPLSLTYYELPRQHTSGSHCLHCGSVTSRFCLASLARASGIRSLTPRIVPGQGPCVAFGFSPQSLLAYGILVVVLCGTGHHAGFGARGGVGV